MDSLPFRAQGRAAVVLGLEAGELELRSSAPDSLPTLRCVLPRPAGEKLSLVLRVHTHAGIPVAAVSIDVNPGDREFETAPPAVLAMEGYAHLGRAERLAIERRVWDRRAFATGSAA